MGAETPSPYLYVVCSTEEWKRFQIRAEPQFSQGGSRHNMEQSLRMYIEEQVAKMPQVSLSQLRKMAGCSSTKENSRGIHSVIKERGGSQNRNRTESGSRRPSCFPNVVDMPLVSIAKEPSTLANVHDATGREPH